MQNETTYEIDRIVKSEEFNHAVAQAQVPAPSGAKRWFPAVVLRHVGPGGSILGEWELEQDAVVARKVLEFGEEPEQD